MYVQLNSQFPGPFTCSPVILRGMNMMKLNSVTIYNLHSYSKTHHVHDVAFYVKYGNNSKTFCHSSYFSNEVSIIIIHIT